MLWQSGTEMSVFYLIILNIQWNLQFKRYSLFSKQTQTKSNQKPRQKGLCLLLLEKLGSRVGDLLAVNEKDSLPAFIDLGI